MTTRRSLSSILLNPKLISVLLAALLWIYVVGVRGPDTTKSVEAQVMAVNVPQGYVVSGSLPAVSITLRGPMSTLWNLTSDYVTPTVDLRGRADGSFIASVQAQVVGLTGVTVEAVNPKDVNVQLERLQTVTVPVHAEVSGTLPQSLVLGVLRVEPATIEVSGPGSLVNQVKEAALEVALDKVGTATGGNLTIAGDVVAYDTRGHVIDGVLLSPRSAVAVLPILDATTLKTIPVVPDITGYPANGYAIAGASCTPAVVMVTGNSAVLSQIRAVLTAPLDVSDATANLVKQVNVVVPAGVSIVGETKTVSCKVTVEPVLALAVPDVALEVRGAESRWKVSLGTASVSVLVSGTDSAIKTLQASQIKPYIDVSQPALADGTYEVFVDGLPQGVVSASVTPQSVAADIQKGQ